MFRVRLPVRVGASFCIRPRQTRDHTEGVKTAGDPIVFNIAFFPTRARKSATFLKSFPYFPWCFQSFYYIKTNI